MNAKFDALEKLKENNWKEEEKKTKKSLKKTKAKVDFYTQVACMKIKVFLCFKGHLLVKNCCIKVVQCLIFDVLVLGTLYVHNCAHEKNMCS